MTSTRTSTIEETLKSSRRASQEMAVVGSDLKRQALLRFAERIDERRVDLLAANARDCLQWKDRIPESLYQRLKLDDAKLTHLVNGVRDVAKMEDPVGKVLTTTLLDDGLTLERVSVPLGVVAIIFESRPDVIPQILSLILKSGNAVVLKGGTEASHSNRAFMGLVDQLGQDCGWLPHGWAVLVEGRQSVEELLGYPEYVDLVIPRGSNQMVRSIMNATRIPVLGHAEGVCHLYVHSDADVESAVALAIDSKSQYPAACNSIETLLVDESVAPGFFPLFGEAAREAEIRLKGCGKTRSFLPDVESASDADWGVEFGDKTLAVRVTGSMDEAIRHINRYGSHHTDSIATRSSEAGERFLRAVDSASVLVNASTRFADGYRYGLGAEIGISTARTHARGPVGVEGLVIYKYKLRGQGHVVRDYVGPHAKPFKHIRH